MATPKLDKDYDKGFIYLIRALTRKICFNTYHMRCKWHKWGKTISFSLNETTQSIKNHVTAWTKTSMSLATPQKPGRNRTTICEPPLFLVSTWETFLPNKNFDTHFIMNSNQHNFVQGRGRTNLHFQANSRSDFHLTFKFCHTVQLTQKFTI